MRTPPNERLTSDIDDAQAGAGKPAPERKCILSGEHGARDTLVRLAISPDGDVLPDVQAKAPGRGAWLGADRAALEEAMASGRLRGALARAFKGAPLSVPDDLPQRIEDSLTRAFLDRLGLEMRGGNIILGSERIAETARGGGIGLLLHASDASEGGASRLDQAWRVGSDAEGSGQRGTRLPLDRDALSVALGGANVVHLGVSSRGSRGTARSGKSAADRVGTALQRLLQFTGAPLGPSGGALTQSTQDSG
ncbi:DUF448 domain-containing protein [Altererythrobacter sp. MTPC7]|uniref:DUF448 domain-containing protein n=1 Tax=Altererythrobacter sp. MTPC7 TaxID=3056567 RepID=UPI0036F30C96